MIHFGLFDFVLLILIIILFVKNLKYWKMIRELKIEVDRLNWNILNKKKEPTGHSLLDGPSEQLPQASRPTDKEFISDPFFDPTPSVSFSPPKKEEEQNSIESNAEDFELTTPAPPAEPSAFDETMNNLKKQFAENWTGVVGSMAIVIGAVFLGIYGALFVGPFYKFLITLGFSLALLGISYKLKNIEKWGGLGNWIGSAGVAIYLFNCLASVSMPAMKWVHSPMMAIALIVSGIMANIAFGSLTGNQKIVSLHVLLSLLVLSILPVRSFWPLEP